MPFYLVKSADFCNFEVVNLALFALAFTRSGQTLQLHFPPKVRVFSLRC